MHWRYSISICEMKFIFCYPRADWPLDICCQDTWQISFSNGKYMLTLRGVCFKLVGTSRLVCLFRCYETPPSLSIWFQSSDIQFYIKSIWSQCLLTFYPFIFVCFNHHCNIICVFVSLLFFFSILSIMVIIASLLKSWPFEWKFELVWFYGISTIASYLMPNPVFTYILNIRFVNTFYR